jgi:hypothetical protein
MPGSRGTANWWEYQVVTGGRISSRLEDLDKANAIHPWIPNSKAVRPNLNEKTEKERQIAEILTVWKSLKDYILYRVFKAPVIDGQVKAANLDNFVIDEWIFQPSLFKYDLPSYANHHILWNSKHDFHQDFVDEIVTSQIKSFLGDGDLDLGREEGFTKGPRACYQQAGHLV